MTKAGNSQIMRTITLLITILSLSFPAYAKYGGGTGEPNDPYLIYTAEQLNTIGAEPNDWDKHFILEEDIDLSDYDGEEGRPAFNVIGDGHGKSRLFRGVFDGNDHTISHLTIIGNDDDDYLGLFGYLSYKAKVKDLGIVDVNIFSGKYGFDIGGLAGNSSGTITNCFTMGTVTSGVFNFGGLVGSNGGIVFNCYSTVSVKGDDSQVGGLVGHNMGSVINCYSTGDVEGDDNVGGLVGGNGGTVIGCYSTGEVSGDSDIGGLVGDNFMSAVVNCYSTGEVSGNDSVGGLVGNNWDGIVIGCYSSASVFGWIVDDPWDRSFGDLVGNNSAGTVVNSFSSGSCLDTRGEGYCGISKTHDEMTTATTFLDAGWDFLGERQNGLHETWQMPATEGYPILSIFNDYHLPLLPGEGTPESPYLISTDEELGSIVNRELGACYRLVQNINLSGIRWSLAVIPNVRGEFDGNGHTIRNLVIEGYTTFGFALGFVGIVESEAQIWNLGLADAFVSGTGNVTGILAGANYGDVMNCYSTGSVKGDWPVGGLVGENRYMWNCYSRASASGNHTVGGLVGRNLPKGSIEYSYSTGEVDGSYEVGGLVGVNRGTVTTSFWDMETSGQTTSAVGTDLTTAEMQMESTFLEAGWDFVGETVNGPNDVWKMWDGYDYPRLKCEPGPNTPLVFVDINEPGFYGQMSRYEVTNAQYCDFLNAALASGDITVDGNDVYGAGGSNAGEDYAEQRYYRADGSGYTGYGATNGGAARIHYSAGAFGVDNGFGNHPVTYVSWYGAMAFANYYGYYLPAEDQWQAVADYDGTYIYGCGQIIDPGIANYRDSEHPDGTTPVGSFGIYGYGMSDMAGNVWEWTSSSLDSNRVFRGGSLGSIDSDCDISIRGDGIPYANYYDIGFRVCR